MSHMPHGGALINRYAHPSTVDDLLRKCEGLKSWPCSEKELADLELIACGALSPLTGFMTRSDYRGVIDHMRLSKGLPWTVPVTLAVSESFGASLKPGMEIALLDESRKPIATLAVQDVYDFNPIEYAHKVFKTTDQSHPGVAALYAMGPKFVGGEITMIRRRNHKLFAHQRLDPSETRELFDQRRWRTVAGFQARTAIHRAQEYTQKCALETVDGLLIHSLAGNTAGQDVPPEVRMRCCEALADTYFPKNRVVLAVIPAVDRVWGPREAVFQAIVEKNYGCTHFIVGPDPALPGAPAGPQETQEVFRQIDAKELGITPLFFEDAFFCKGCGGMATAKTCPHTDVARLAFTGPAVREMLQKGRPLPIEFTRPEVGLVLTEAFKARKADLL